VRAKAASWTSGIVPFDPENAGWDYLANEREFDEALFSGGFAGESGRIAFSGEMGGEECFRFCGGFSVGR